MYSVSTFGAKALLHRQVLDKQRLEDQLAVAREVQSGLLPASPPRLPGYDIAAANLPSHAIGGDYYDYLPMEEGRLGLVVADVSGKGIPAALIMAAFRAALRTEIRRRASLTALAAQLNGAVLELRDASRYVTAVCGVLEAASGQVTYVNCGHNPPLLLRGGGGRETLRRKGAPPSASSLARLPSAPPSTDTRPPRSGGTIAPCRLGDRPIGGRAAPVAAVSRCRVGGRREREIR